MSNLNREILSVDNGKTTRNQSTLLNTLHSINKSVTRTRIERIRELFKRLQLFNSRLELHMNLVELLERGLIQTSAHATVDVEETFEGGALLRGALDSAASRCVRLRDEVVERVLGEVEHRVGEHLGERGLEARVHHANS